MPKQNTIDFDLCIIEIEYRYKSKKQNMKMAGKFQIGKNHIVLISRWVKDIDYNTYTVIPKTFVKNIIRINSNDYYC